MTEETIRTICWAFAACFTVQGITVYSIVRLIVTSKPLFERKGADISRFNN